jgi:hypothetical protein
MKAMMQMTKLDEAALIAAAEGELLSREEATDSTDDTDQTVYECLDPGSSVTIRDLLTYCSETYSSQRITRIRQFMTVLIRVHP